MIKDEYLLLLVMAIVPVKDDYILQQIRERFFKRDRPHTEWDVQAQYRLEQAEAIIARWKKV